MASDPYEIMVNAFDKKSSRGSFALRSQLDERRVREPMTAAEILVGDPIAVVPGRRGRGSKDETSA